MISTLVKPTARSMATTACAFGPHQFVSSPASSPPVATTSAVLKCLGRGEASKVLPAIMISSAA